MDCNERQVSPKIAYLIKCFPRLSETFILHEVLELERQGLPLRIYSLLKPTGKMSKAVQEVQAPVTYIPNGFPFGTLLLLAVAIQRFFKAPWCFLCISIAALVRHHHSSTPKHLLYAMYLAYQLEREGITHIHAHYANVPTTVVLLAHQFTGIPYSFTAHAKDIYLSRKATLAYKMRKARFVVTCTAYNQHYLRTLVDQCPDEHIHCIYHGLNLRIFPSNTSIDPDPVTHPLILTIARLVEKKGLPYLLQACRMLKDQGYNFTCRIVGEGPLRSILEQEISKLALTDLVELRGAETHERVIEMYQHARMLVLPCIVGKDGDRDGIPNVLVESLHMGVPVVSTSVSGIPELITSEINGLLVEPHDSAALAFAMARLLDDPLLCRRLTLAGQQTVLERFDMARNTTYLKSLFLGQTSVCDLQSISGDSIPTYTASQLNARSNNIELGAR